MDRKIIINISRECGSSGHSIGKKIADDLGINFYDRLAIEREAKKSGINQELFRAVDKQQTNSFLYSIAMSIYSYGEKISAAGTVSMSDRLYLVQNDIIKNFAQNSCVIVGRCANFILRKEDCVNVFIYADLEKRIEHIMDIEGLNEDKAKDYINKIDKKRSSYYNYYTSEKWGTKAYNDMIIDSTVVGVTGCVSIIKQLIKEKYNVSDFN
ncbi:MAG: cytidylate kinase-like family protein [Clostridiales bacterium]|nr:cytidylate kinase-like family protein [Clostridiales bacterium]